MKKFELTNESIVVNGKKLFRIKALRSFGIVKVGDLGGFIEKEANLDNDGYAWIFGNAKVFDNAKVFGDAWVDGSAQIYGDSQVFENAWIKDNAQVYDHAWIYGHSEVFGKAQIFTDSCVCGNAIVCETAQINGASVSGNVYIARDAKILNDYDYACVKGFGSEARITTFYKNKDDGISVVCGCFRGTIDEFRAKVEETHRKSKWAKEYLMIANLMEYHFLDISR